MQVLKAVHEILEAQELFIQTFKSRTSTSISVSVGFQGGSVDTEVLWIPSLGIWGFFGDPPLEESPSKRFWNAFGKGKPHGMENIVAEINPPKYGINRRVAGAFLKMDSGGYGVAHRGIFTANGRVPYEFVRSNFNFPISRVIDGNHISDFYVIGGFSDADFLESLRNFIDGVYEFKTIARNRTYR